MKSPLTFACLLLAPVLSLGQSTIDSTKKFAWSGNTGWINFKANTNDGLVFGESYLSGFAWSGNIGWINFGDGSPANGHTYSNSGDDQGVNHDGAGNLSGFAWSANVGWVNFDWASSNDRNRPRVNLSTGAFQGYVWNGNIGWISLGGEQLTTETMALIDLDDDTIADSWEWRHFENLTTADSQSDFDGDGASDRNEYLAGSDPKDSASFLTIISTIYSATFDRALPTFTSSPTRFYSVYYSEDLGQSSPWQLTGGVTQGESGNTTTHKVGIPPTQKLFLKVEASRPLTP